MGCGTSVGARTSLAGQGVVDHPVDTRGEGLDIEGVDGRKHANAELVASNGGIRVNIDDAVGRELGDQVSVGELVAEF